MPLGWIRSESVDFPQVYAEFQVQVHSGDDVTSETLVIADVEESRFDEVINIMRDKHLVEESMYSSKGVRDCPVSLSEMTCNWRNMLNQKVSLVCYAKDDISKRIIAVNVIGVITETEFDTPHCVSFFQSSSLRQLCARQITNYVSDVNVFSTKAKAGPK